MQDTGTNDPTAAKPGPRRTLRIILIAAVVLLATGFGLALIPSVVGRLGPSSVSIHTKVGAPATILGIPPFGTVSARTHWTPLRLRFEIEEVDIETLGALATSGAGREELASQVEADLRKLVVRAAIQVALGAAFLAAVVGLLIFHRRWGPVIVCSVSGCAFVVGLMAMTASAYDVDQFDQPKFSGSLTKARVVIDALQEGADLLDEARFRYRIVTKRISNLLVLLAQPDRDPRSSETVVLHVSDIHANPIAFDFIDQLIREFDIDTVIDTGDASSAALDTGEISTLAGPVDDALARAMRRLGVDYLFVPGNHDSLQFRRRLKRVANVDVLDEEVGEINGLDVLGWSDPTFSTTPVPEDEKKEERRAVAPEVGSAVVANRPDILAVHDQTLAERSFGNVPLVLAGHTHEADMKTIDETLILTVGSTGATGVKSFTVESDRSYEAEILYFNASGLRAVDYIELKDLGGDFVLTRTSFDKGEPSP